MSTSASEGGGKLGQLWAELVADLAPLRTRGFGIILDKRSGDEGENNAPAVKAGMRQRVAHELDAAALPLA